MVVFKAGANKRHFSQCNDLFIMNGKLLSSLVLGWQLTTNERLVSRVNGIFREASGGIKKGGTPRRSGSVQRRNMKKKRWGSGTPPALSALQM